MPRMERAGFSRDCPPDRGAVFGLDRAPDGSPVFDLGPGLVGSTPVGPNRGFDGSIVFCLYPLPVCGSGFFSSALSSPIREDGPVHALILQFPKEGEGWREVCFDDPDISLLVDPYIHADHGEPAVAGLQLCSRPERNPVDFFCQLSGVGRFDRGMV